MPNPLLASQPASTAAMQMPTMPTNPAMPPAQPTDLPYQPQQQQQQQQQQQPAQPAGGSTAPTEARRTASLSSSRRGLPYLNLNLNLNLNFNRNLSLNPNLISNLDPKSIRPSLNGIPDHPALHACVCGNKPPPVNPNPNFRPESRRPSLHPAPLSTCCTPSLPATAQIQLLYLLLPQRCRTHSTPLCSRLRQKTWRLLSLSLCFSRPPLQSI